MSSNGNLQFRVNHQTLHRTDSNKVVEGSLNYIQANFKFTSDWDNLKKIVIVDYKRDRYKVELDEENKVLLPSTVIRFPFFKLSVYAVNENEDLVITSSIITIPVSTSLSDGKEPQDAITEIKSDTLEVTRDGSTATIELPSDFQSLKDSYDELEEMLIFERVGNDGEVE